MITSECLYDFILCVPMDRFKLMEREFNQAELIAEILSKACGIPLLRTGLQKHLRTPLQIHLNRTERKANLWGAFGLARGVSVSGRSILLVDDIITTGATAESAARILKEAGAKRVDFLALARTEAGVSARKEDAT